ncbi:hypothetical protein ASPBRDRAFT_563001 [Aspergillus brasiliensis CBS 101740]|uniref:Uncharacterized protein n=1 Tax=Aspergillus brasiliensis (strain CBS 101740 / IMI 381727 / IBT 21946) TaxID=767769 RepID=A0A1L9UN35_ASPBC|nr:hypothetical protein ASPBRDRAFT_563001 [Aspergillus brasiliensis CBS 101740]
MNIIPHTIPSHPCSLNITHAQYAHSPSSNHHNIIPSTETPTPATTITITTGTLRQRQSSVER